MPVASLEGWELGLTNLLKTCPYDLAETHTIASPKQYLSAGTKLMSVASEGYKSLQLTKFRYKAPKK